MSVKHQMLTKKKLSKSWIYNDSAFCLFSKCFGENEIQTLEVSTMRRRKRRTFEELVLENKKELLSNEEFLNQLEEKLEERFRQK